MLPTLYPEDMKNLPPLLFVIDGTGLLYRAWHATPDLVRSDGLNVGGVVGYAKMLATILPGLVYPYKAVVCFDSGKPTFRKYIFPDYKANRAAPREEMVEQHRLAHVLSEAYGMKVYRKQGWEADDLVATLARQGIEKGYKVNVVAADKDLLQIQNVLIYDPSTKATSSSMGKFNVTPDKVPDMFALLGDTADNIPGVKGIGKVSAIQMLINNSLIDLLETPSKLEKAVKSKVYSEAENIIVYRRLALLQTNAPVTLGEVDNISSTNIADLLAFLKLLQASNAVTHLENKFGVKASNRTWTWPRVAPALPKRGFLSLGF